MRTLYENLLSSATLSATNEDANYPIENVYDTTMRSLFKADTNSTVITVTLSEASTVDCFAFGNHNILTASVKLTDSASATTTYNYTAADLRFSTSDMRAMVYETAVDDVEEIEYTITSTLETYIGSLWAGEYLQWPYFSIAPKLGNKSSGSRYKSRGGVTYNNPGINLKTFSCTFDANSLADTNAQELYFDTVQTYVPHWVDRWEGSSDYPAFFSQLTKAPSHIKGEGLIYDSYRLDLEECR